MRPEDREADEPKAMHNEAMCDMKASRPRGLDLKRKDELFQLAKGIAAQVSELTQRHERCLLRRMVEMLLDG